MEAAATFTSSFQRWMASLASDGLTYPRLRVLEELHCRGPAKLKSLADLVGMSARNITALADGLEAEGFARRIDHPTDRRVTLLELTAAGEAEAEDALAPRLARMGELFDRLSPEERDDLERMLHTIVDAIDRIDDGAAPSPD
jgi:DNA-binding MarR family transcriptional regulator